MSVRRISYLVALGLLAVGVAYGQQRDSVVCESPAGQVAVVISMYGEYATAVNITLPTDCTEADAHAALEQISEHTGWQFDTPIIGDETEAATDGCMSVQANLVGLSTVQPGGMQAVAPLIMALAQYPEAAIIYIGTKADSKSVGSFENRFVSVSWLQQGGVCSYQISVKDDSFSSIEELTAAESAESDEPGTSSGVVAWFLLVAAAAMVGAILYRVAGQMILRRR